MPLLKKGDKGEVNNFRGVCLLAMGSRILARIAAKRLEVWAEKVDILDDNQVGFRRGRSTADVVQVMARLEEDVEDLRRSVLAGSRDLDQGDWPEARLLDLRKAYPRVNKPALWMLLNRYWLGENMIRVIKGLHETTSYKVRGKEGVSGEWLPERGLREGCSTYAVFFNIYPGGSQEGLSQVPKPGRGGVLRPRQWWCHRFFLLMTPPLCVGGGNWGREWGR